MYRPGGMSSEEDDWDDDYYSQDIPTTNRVVTTYQASIEEQLLSAVVSKDIIKVKELVNQGVDVNYKPHDNWNSIIQASSAGNYELLEFLIENGADVNSAHEKFTPLLAVCSSNSRDEDQLESCLDLLLAKGARINVSDWYRMSPLSHAVRHNHRKLVTKLIEEKADVNSTDQDGWTPIFYAVDSGNADLVVLLSGFGSQMYCLDMKGRSLLDIALEKEKYEIAKLLSEVPDIEKLFNEIGETEKRLNALERIVLELPRKEDRLSGFKQDMLTILSAIQLNHLNEQFYRNEIGLGHLLTINDDRLREIGIHFWFERKKIIRTVEKFHEHPWCMSSFGGVVSQPELDFFQISQLMATVTRQMYLISVSTYWWAELGGCDNQTKTLPDTLKENRKTIKVLRKKLKLLEILIKKIDKEQNATPSDFIRPQKTSRRSYFKVILIGSVITAFLAYKRSPRISSFFQLKS